MCHCGPEANVWRLPQFLSTLCFEIQSMDDLEIMVLVRPAGQGVLRILLSVEVLGIEERLCWHAGTETVSPMETSLQHLV